MAIGMPSIMANLATPVAAVYVTRVWSDFGEAAVAGGAIIDRVIPLAFAVVFALTGSVGPIIGQNFGAGLIDRVRRAITDALALSLAYALFAWAALALAAPWIAAAFDAHAAARISSSSSAVSASRRGCSSPACSSPTLHSTISAFPCWR